MNFCPHCGKQVKTGAVYCGSCGAPIHDAMQTSSLENELAFSVGNSGKQQFSSTEFSMKNTQQRIVNLWIILLFLFLFLIFLPSLINLDGMDGGFALSFVSGFMVIMSLIVILMYRSRAKQLKKMLAGEGRIAVWTYSSDEWSRFIEVDFEAERKAKRFLFLLISAIAVVIGIILLLVVKDVLILFIALGIIPLVAIPAFLAPRMRYKKLMNSEPKALISENGVIVGKMFHLWVKMGARLDQVVFVEDEQPPILEFHYSMPSRHGRQEEVARIPVPRGKTDEAVAMGNYFASLNEK